MAAHSTALLLSALFLVPLVAVYLVRRRTNPFGIGIVSIPLVTLPASGIWVLATQQITSGFRELGLAEETSIAKAFTILESANARVVSAELATAVAATLLALLSFFALRSPSRAGNASRPSRMTGALFVAVTFSLLLGTAVLSRIGSRCFLFPLAILASEDASVLTDLPKTGDAIRELGVEESQLGAVVLRISNLLMRTAMVGAALSVLSLAAFIVGSLLLGQSTFPRSAGMAAVGLALAAAGAFSYLALQQHEIGAEAVLLRPRLERAPPPTESLEGERR